MNVTFCDHPWQRYILKIFYWNSPIKTRSLLTVVANKQSSKSLLSFQLHNAKIIMLITNNNQVSNTSAICHIICIICIWWSVICKNYIPELFNTLYTITSSEDHGYCNLRPGFHLFPNWLICSCNVIFMLLQMKKTSIS